MPPLPRPCDRYGVSLGVSTGQKIVTVRVKGRLIVNDALTHLEACLAGHGVAQVMEFGIEAPLKDGKLINLFPAWTDELFPLYAYHPSRHFVPVKMRAFLDFIVHASRIRPPG